MLLSSKYSASVGRNAARPSRPARAPVQVVRAHGHGHGHGHGSSGATQVLTEKDRGFIAEMRKVAMKMHTKDQAPKEGEKEAPKQGPWTPTRPGYLRFLTESKVVFDAFERLVNTSEQYKLLRTTGLERGYGLAKDVAWFEAKFNMTAPEPQQDGPGMNYARFLEGIAKSDPPTFICHFYNFYFAHTAGGRMIGTKVSGMLLDGHTLNFYKWDADVNELLERVRKSINTLAEGWTDAQKERCLKETEDTFKMAGTIMKHITDTA